MKFRQFEFRLFPRIRSRKKKKTKFSHPDYPRDISLDKNCNIYKNDFPCFYDNLAVEAAISEQFSGYMLCKGNGAVFDTFEKSLQGDSDTNTFPLRELKIDINSTCCCEYCTNVTSKQMTCDVLPGSCSGTSIGTPNTIPRSRTRIKTNPWLPSPRSTPSPSPTDHYQRLIADPSECDVSGKFYVTRPNTLPLMSSSDSDCYASVRNFATTLKGLDEIPENELINDGCSKKLCDTKGEYLYKTIRKGGNSVIPEGKIQSPVNELLKDDLNYETYVSSCSSPLNEFLKCVKYQIDFSYEHNADRFLESSAFPRDDSFNSSINTNTDIPEEEVHGNSRIVCQTSIEEEVDLTFDDTPNNMQESIDTGYASVSRDSDFLSSDDEFGLKSDSRCEIKDEDYVNDERSDYHSNDSTKITNNEVISESSKEYGEQATKATDSCDHTDDETNNDNAIDIDQRSDNSQTSDLEWDDDPMAQTLFLEFPLVIPAQNDDIVYTSPTNRKNTSVLEPVKRYGSVKYRRNKGKYSDTECSCYRRRSRSLADIELSLDEKVVLLREEKSFVQRKIHEAILEEKLKEHQMKIFRLLNGDQKKQLIVKTLNDLKTRLEDQSARLQASYSTVISLQNMYSKRRRNRIFEAEEK